MNALHGWLVVDKLLGLTSAQVVGAVKRILRQGGHGKPKAGHGGTLDPLATGVLPIAVGEATKLAGHLLNGNKGYRFTVAWGTATATDDAEGAVISTSDSRPGETEIVAALPRFTGPIRQRPPAYSALKIDGRRAYALARAGEEVELATRDLTIHALSLVRHDLDSATFDVHCSKGTYVRSLARDLALALGTAGHVSMLRRTIAGPFTLDAAISLDKLEELVQTHRLEQVLLPLTAGLDDIPAFAVTSSQAVALRQGRVLAGCFSTTGLALATDGSVPVALVRVSTDEVRVVRGFNL